jgi:hypothetical protein
MGMSKLERLGRFEREYAGAEGALHAGDLGAAHLGFTRAHALGQEWTVPHVRAHWGYARVALRCGESRAALRQGLLMLTALLLTVPLARLRAPSEPRVASDRT